jgi:hypothetical protein
MARLRLNTEYRTKIGNRIEDTLMQNDTEEKQRYLNARVELKPIQDQTWLLAKEVIQRTYTPEDIEKAWYLQNKFDNVNTIEKDSCFHFGFNGEELDKDKNEMVEKRFTKHFDFTLGARVDGTDTQTSRHSSGDNSKAFAYAYFRDELLGQEGCDPDINIKMKDKDPNPHWTKYSQNNNTYLGFDKHDDKDGEINKVANWNKDFEIDLIGREYCRDRQVDCTAQEFEIFMKWQGAKGHLITCHSKWIETLQAQVKEIKVGLKGYRYLDEGIELANELGCNLSDAEIIRTNSTGLTIYNPKNLADRIKSMNKVTVSREDKIAIYKKAMADRKTN